MGNGHVVAQSIHKIATPSGRTLALTSNGGSGAFDFRELATTKALRKRIVPVNDFQPISQVHVTGKHLIIVKEAQAPRNVG
jgi:hypothetical protein